MAEEVQSALEADTPPSTVEDTLQVCQLLQTILHTIRSFCRHEITWLWY